MRIKALIALFALTASAAMAQKGVEDGSRFGHGQDSIDCLNNISLYSENLKTKNYADAIAFALKSNEYLENATAMKVAGTAASALQKNEEAIQYLEKYLELSPNAKDAAQMKYTIAATAQVMGNKEKAKAYYQQILTDPKFGPTAAEQIKTL